MNTTTHTSAPRLSEAEAEQLVRAATLAPSLHNAQPWAFSVSPERVDLYADSSRQMRNADPSGRSLLVSCGAALFNLRVAAERLGLRPRIRVLPDDGDLTHVAVVEFGPRRRVLGPLAVYYPEIVRRRTNRFPFRNRLIPGSVLATLGQAARAEGAVLRIFDDPNEVELVVRLLRDAELSEPADRLAERREWVGGDPDRSDGIPTGSLGPRPAASATPFRDLGSPSRRDHASFEAAPTVAVLSTTHDSRADWVLAGQALERLLLAATAAGVSASFLNQPLEQDELRWLARHPVTGVGHSQMILRLGYGDEVRATPRRPLADVIRT